MTPVLSAIALVSFLAALVFWIYGLAKWDGKNPCTHEDCDSCPFPRCEEGAVNKNNIERKEHKHD